MIHEANINPLTFFIYFCLFWDLIWGTNLKEQKIITIQRMWVRIVQIGLSGHDRVMVKWSVFLTSTTQFESRWRQGSLTQDVFDTCICRRHFVSADKGNFRYHSRPSDAPSVNEPFTCLKRMKINDTEV